MKKSSNFATAKPSKAPRHNRDALKFQRKDAGVVDRGGLENRCALAGTQGSNPCLSANWLDNQVFAKSTPNITPRNGSNIGCFVGIK